jgi:hypothetical protein
VRNQGAVSKKLHEALRGAPGESLLMSIPDMAHGFADELGLEPARLTAATAAVDRPLAFPPRSHAR